MCNAFSHSYTRIKLSYNFHNELNMFWLGFRFDAMTKVQNMPIAFNRFAGYS